LNPCQSNAFHKLIVIDHSFFIETEIYKWRGELDRNIQKELGNGLVGNGIQKNISLKINFEIGTKK
jgi:hypothetical protein